MKNEESRVAREYTIGIIAGLMSGVIVVVMRDLVGHIAAWKAVTTMFVVAVILYFVGWLVIRVLVWRDP